MHPFTLVFWLNFRNRTTRNLGLFLSLSIRICWYIISTLLLIFGVLAAILGSVFYLSFFSSIHIISGYISLRALHAFLLNVLGTSSDGSPLLFLFLASLGPVPNPHYTSASGILDMTHWPTYALVGTLGFTTLFIVIFIVTCGISIAKGSQDNADSGTDGLETPSNSFNFRAHVRAEEEDWTHNPSYEIIATCVYTVAVALLGVGLLRIWKGKPVWDPAEGLSTGVDGVSYRHALAAMVLGRVVWWALQVIIDLEKSDADTAVDANTSTSSEVAGGAAVSPGHDEKKIVDDKV